VTLAQHAVDDKTNEITAVETLLQLLVLASRIVTMDALLTQRHVAQTIVDNGGDYVMIVKENQPQLRADIALVFTLPPVGDRQATGRLKRVAWARAGVGVGVSRPLPKNRRGTDGSGFWGHQPAPRADDTRALARFVARALIY